ncbi:TIGR04283 family arsenosugar biosynthesis glycosyltransferase [Azospirillum sp. sgz302134]
MSLAIVIPTLNAAATLPATLAALSWEGALVVADGGSTDDTRGLARAAGATVVRAPRGRGPQLATGAVAVTETWILFLHADTRLESGWRPAVERFMADPENASRAAYFRLRFACEHPAARRVERMARWRARALGLPYGDQGLLIARSLYDSVGGFAPLPLMEDVDLVRRLGRHRLCKLPVDAVTSPARYERDGWWARPLRNLACLSLYFAGVPPRLIGKLYG